MRLLTTIGDRILSTLAPRATADAAGMTCGRCFEDKNGNLIHHCCWVSGGQTACGYKYC